MPFIDLGRKSNSGPEVAQSAPEAPKVTYPGFHVELDKAPDMKLDEEKTVSVKLKLTGVRKDTWAKGKISLDFDVVAIDFGKESKKTDAEEFEEVMTADMKEMARK